MAKLNKANGCFEDVRSSRFPIVKNYLITIYDNYLGILSTILPTGFG